MANNNDQALPPLEWLRAFEAAGRLRNFTAAAREVGLTQAAVSQRIGALEARLGVSLFRRLPRGVELTVDGDAYLPHVSNALEAIRRGTEDLFARPQRKVSLVAPASTAALWIAPRLRALTSAQPGLQISLDAIHRVADYEGAEADYEVRFGAGQWEGRRALRLYEEVLVPGVAPELLDSAPEGDWRRLPVLAVKGPRDGWRQWAVATRQAPVEKPALRFDSFMTALEAARSGAGVLLASLPLSGAAIASGAIRLVDAEPHVMPAGLWLTWPEDAGRGLAHERIIAALTREDV